tara:strand:+ start:1549 stop:2196 length:648 start_codon:yes stop_codon:yes gene_type:complete
MSDLKVDAITAANANTAITIKGAGTGKVKLGDGNLLFPDADGSANQLIKTDGSGNLAFVDAAGITLGSDTAATSGNSVTFGSIPAGTKLIIINIEALSSNSTGTMGVTIGDAGGLETSGYVAGHTEAQAGTQTTTSTSQFPIVTSFIAANNISGTVTLTLKDAANFTWVQTHSWNDAGDLGWGAGVKSLSAELTQLAIVTANTFDGSGSISITYM